ncbi:uncharacterized protein LOC143896053 [Temnothorax americanus]|uniref:uncharacterized protein LOC143896053 n=1 Tax=Temnothorax americanus TaxID=1964332 RepID=UPI0040688D9C
MTRCAVKGCQNIKPQRKSGNLSFFSFPRDEIVCKAWVKACKNEEVNTKNGRVCSIHFLPTAYKEQTWYQKIFSSVYKPRLNDGAIPTENLDLDVIDTRNESALGEVENIEYEDFTAFEQQDINENMESTTSKNQNSMPAKELQRIQKLKCKTPNRKKRIPNESYYYKVMQNNIILRNKLKASETANNKLMRKLKIANKMLEVRNRKILKLLDKKRYYKEILERIFTPGQINILLDPKKKQKKTRWCAEDIAAAINLRSISPKAYRYLRTTMKIPLPSFSTLGKWAQKLNMEEGILKDVLLIMKQKAKTMKSFEKLAVISYDEVYISDQMSIDRKEEQVIGQHRTCQVMMARGLFSKWKQPVFYEYDKPVTKENLTEILEQLFEYGFTVVAAIRFGAKK